MNRFLTATICAIAALAPSLGQAQQGYVWAYDRYDGESIFDTSLNLNWGVPQSDDLRFTAYCVVGALAPFVRVTLAADIGDLPSGAAVRLHVSDAPYAQVIPATVVRLEELLYGVEFPLAVTDPLLGALAARSNLIYAVEGQAAMNLSLRGSATPVRQFTNACAGIRGNQPATGAPGDTGK